MTIGATILAFERAFDRCLRDEERERPDSEGQRELLERIDGDVVRAYVDEQ